MLFRHVILCVLGFEKKENSKTLLLSNTRSWLIRNPFTGVGVSEVDLLASQPPPDRQSEDNLGRHCAPHNGHRPQCRALQTNVVVGSQESRSVNSLSKAFWTYRLGIAATPILGTGQPRPRWSTLKKMSPNREPLWIIGFSQLNSPKKVLQWWSKTDNVTSSPS